ncbi:hypothetical protein BC828DRAFT_410149 [Blastocladiella britannica]|nr:hypothetical protein BC828DRAFT_410149 [Blastocladiella britannica]
MTSIDHGSLAMHVLQHAAAQSRAVEDALELLRVLPQLDDVGLMTAVLWRRCPELAPPLAAAHDLLDLFRLYPLPKLFDQGEMIGLAVDPTGADMHRILAACTLMPGLISTAMHAWVNDKGIGWTRVLKAHNSLTDALHASDLAAATATYVEMSSGTSSVQSTGNLVKQVIRDTSVCGDVHVLDWV